MVKKYVKILLYFVIIPNKLSLQSVYTTICTIVHGRIRIMDVFSVSGSASLSFSAESFTYSWPVESQAASKKETEHGQGFHFCRIDEYRALHSWPKNGAYRERLLIINTVYISWGYKIRKNCAFMTPSISS